MIDKVKGTSPSQGSMNDVFVLSLQLANTFDYGSAEEITPIIQDVPLDLHFPTIDAVTLASLREEDPTPPCSPVVELPAPSTPRVGEELIRTCVTPRKVTKVQEALEREKECHKCALKLLPYVFTKEELASSNTNGTHKKACKLNSLKTLVEASRSTWFQLRCKQHNPFCHVYFTRDNLQVLGKSSRKTWMIVFIYS